MGVYMGVLTLLPFKKFGWIEPSNWPHLAIEALPRQLGRLISRIPRTMIDELGYLCLTNSIEGSQDRMPLVRTAWNLDRTARADRLRVNRSWGIVLHWFGDRERHNLSLPGYMSGFNGERIVNEKITRTSAHFLVGNDDVVSEVEHDLASVGIIQTQAPDSDGVPYLSSHLVNAPFADQPSKDNYFVRALEKLSTEIPTINSILPNLFFNPDIDPNLVTISIEIAGYDFDNPDKFPTMNKILNVVSLVVAIMKRYKISATNILGHNEFTTKKADPGKNFLALIRFLVGVKALAGDDQELNELVFSEFVSANGDLQQAVSSYFKFVRDYLLLLTSPEKVYEWEARSKYWQLIDVITGNLAAYTLTAGSFSLPFRGFVANMDGNYIRPNNHEGVDIIVNNTNDISAEAPVQPIKLMANGECIYIGKSRDSHWGRTVIFRHRQADSAELLSIYAHLSEFGALKVGSMYKKDYHIGGIERSDGIHPGFLHFAIAYGGTWDKDLKQKPYVPPNVGPTWIRQRFLDPIAYLRDMNSRYVPKIERSRLQEVLGG